ncbi:aa3-type cytochrome c oxidase subunit IV [Azospirillum sp. 412522]|nr:aa3-type cytochrome c oxidase subunit IV [Azospirillum sp. 412522]MBY6265094.1 aa3-type cytochrome c oxidase subunit IV [Azospirillum sp. 412522]
MAAVSPNPVSAETVRSHQATWIAFTKFMKLSIAGVVAVLVLLAIFTL